MPDDTPASALPGPTPPVSPPARRPWHRNRAAIAAALLAGGIVGAGATAIAQRGSRPVLLALTPAPITAMQDGNAVAIKGQVAEIYGKSFVLSDDSGRALVDTWPRGSGGALVGKAEPLIVQGRFRDGVVHALAIQHADGKTVMLGPPSPPPPHAAPSPHGAGAPPPPPGE